MAWSRWLFANLLLWLILVVINALFLLPTPWRLTMLFVSVSCSVASFAYWIVPALYRWFLQPHSPTLNQIALQVGELVDVHDRLANALQLLRKLESNSEAYSQDLIQEAFNQVAVEMRGRAFRDSSARRPIQQSLWRALATLCAAAALWLFFSNTMNIGWMRLSQPQRDFQPSAETLFWVFPGDAIILHGQDLVVKVLPKSPYGEEWHLGLSKNGNEEKRSLLKGKDDTLRCIFSAVRDSFYYQINAGKIKSRWYRVGVRELATIRTLQVKIYPPGYSRQEPFLLPENVGDVSGLKGSRVEWRAELSKKVDSADLVFASGQTRSVPVTDTRLNAEFVINKDDRYAFSLKDQDAQEPLRQIEYHIRVLADQYPFVRIVSPGRDVELGEDMQLPMLIEAQDDYGLSKMHLVYTVLAAGEEEIDSSRFAYQAIAAPTGDHVRVAFHWDLSASPLLPNETVVYGIVVHDNDTVSGPKIGRSSLYRARFPSLFEMYQDIAQRHDNAQEQLQSIYEQSQDLKKSVEELQQDLLRNPKVDWQKKQQAEDSRKQQEQLTQNLQQFNQALDEMVQKMERNELLSPETLEKYQNLQQLYQEIMTPELEKLMQKLSESMQKLDQNQMKKALEELRLSSEDINKNLDRTIALLKKLKMEQQLDEAERTARKLEEDQQRISEAAQQPPQAKDKLLEQQKSVQENVQRLSDLLKKIEQEMDQQPGMPQKEVQSARARMESSQMKQDFQQMTEMLQKNGATGTGQCSGNIQNQLQQAANELQQAKDKLSGEQQRKAMQALQRGMRDLIELSKREEAVLDRTEGTPAVSPEILKLAEEQQNISSGLQRVTDQLFEASKESFFIDSQIGSALGQAAKNMAQSQASLEERNQMAAAGRQGQAMSELNRASFQMLAALQGMKSGSCSSGMSMSSFMKQMQSLANAQQGINQQSMGMGAGGQQMSMAQQAALARLAAQQGQVRKSMEQLAQEAGSLSGTLGNLDKIIEDMKQVENDLGHEITRQTLQRQQQILSRMLDSYKSVREREYSRKRKAETGKQYAATDPKELPAELGERKEKWQQDLLRAKKQGYSRDYLELIQQYFEALFNDETARN